MLDLKNFFIGIGLFLILHVLVWWSVNLQFIKDEWRDKAIYLSLLFALPIAAIGFYASRMIYDSLGGTAWGVRFVGFGTSYLVFPALTWIFLKESMLTPKTLLCIFLSMLIIIIQVWWK